MKTKNIIGGLTAWDYSFIFSLLVGWVFNGTAFLFIHDFDRFISLDTSKIILLSMLVSTPSLFFIVLTFGRFKEGNFPGLLSIALTYNAGIFVLPLLFLLVFGHILLPVSILILQLGYLHAFYSHELSAPLLPKVFSEMIDHVRKALRK